MTYYELSRKVKFGQIWFNKKTDKGVYVHQVCGTRTQISGTRKDGVDHFWWLLTDTLVRSYICPTLAPEIYKTFCAKKERKDKVISLYIELGTCLIELLKGN